MPTDGSNIELITVQSFFYYPEACLLKGRLESEGIPCCLFDEHIISVHPFRSVAVHGIKLKVNSQQLYLAQAIIENLKSRLLTDIDGTTYNLEEAFEKDYIHEENILYYRSSLTTGEQIPSSGMMLDEMEKTIIREEEMERKKLLENREELNWNEVFVRLFYDKGSVLSYLFNIKPIEAELEDELIRLFNVNRQIQVDQDIVACPDCGSSNTIYGYSVQIRWAPLRLILSFLIFVPFFPIHHQYHCFNCGHDFK